MPAVWHTLHSEDGTPIFSDDSQRVFVAAGIELAPVHRSNNIANEELSVGIAPWGYLRHNELRGPGCTAAFDCYLEAERAGVGWPAEVYFNDGPERRASLPICCIETIRIPRHG